MQTNIFEIMKPRFYFDKDKPIKVFEAFSGIGTQRMALEKLGVKHEHIGCAEIDKHAFNSYNEIFDHQAWNYGDITKIEGWRLAGLDLFTYSFPCQDLSIAGKQKGLNNTRSGLVYEVLRILQELDYNDRPKVLLMENVSALVQKKFINQFNEIQFELEKLGYSNHVKVMNALDYGVAQNRERVFMVSVLGEYYYEFPKPVPLEKQLKDYLLPLEEVDISYFLTNEQKQKLNNSKFESARLSRAKHIDDVCNCITTMQGGGREPKIIVEGVAIPEATKQGYAIATDGDSVNLEYPKSELRRGRVGKKRAQTLTTSCNQGVVLLQKGHGFNKGSQQSNCSSITSSSWHENNYIKDGYLIRKLTPRECWRLMGIDDIAFEEAECVCSDNQLYKQAGNAIVVDVLVAIFRELFTD